MDIKKRVFIIHGWDGYPEEGCFPWLKKELESRGYNVQNPAMPNPIKPVIEEWVPFLAQKISKPDENTFLFGHSIGCQTILRYLQSLSENSKIGGVVLLAPWLGLTDEAFEDEEDRIIAKPWLETPINWEKVKKHTNNFVSIFSDNDPLVPFNDSEIFKNNLGSKIIVEHDKGHFSGSDGITELPSALNSILSF
jgi:predicted alpha/beta hydrolase family esterase